MKEMQQAAIIINVDNEKTAVYDKVCIQLFNVHILVLNITLNTVAKQAKTKRIIHGNTFNEF